LESDFDLWRSDEESAPAVMAALAACRFAAALNAFCSLSAFFPFALVLFVSAMHMVASLGLPFGFAA